jgi:hypothetical protein
MRQQLTFEEALKNRKAPATLPTSTYFIGATILGVSSFIPIIGIFTGIMFWIWLLGWAVCDTKGFLRTLWRTLLVATLLYCSTILYFTPADGNLSQTNLYTIAAIAGSFSACNLMWSLVEAHLKKNTNES